MRLFILLIVVISLLPSCSKKKAATLETCVESFTYLFEANKVISDTTEISGKDTFHFTKEVAGNNIVFKYIHAPGFCGGDPPPTAEMLIFQVNSSLSGFEYRDSSLLDIVYAYEPGFTFHYQPGSPRLSGMQKISKGVITGSKVDNYKWNISVDIQPIQSPSITFNTTFYLYQ